MNNNNQNNNQNNNNKTKFYSGSSKGFTQVSQGFLEYAREVGINRSFASIYDGLKPVQRRALFVLDKEKVSSHIKSAKAVGYVLAYHPHGDGAIYEAMARMTDVNGTVRPFLLDGGGGFGKSYSSSDPASMRYTTMSLSKESRALLLQDMDGVDWKESETDEGLEPVALPSRFPMALTASVQGIGVGLANKVPSFNFNEVIDLTREYIKDGLTFNHQIIYPDLPNGGVVVANNREMAKLMTTGKGEVKSRAKVRINKRDIFIDELPYNATDGGVVSKIKALIRRSKEKKLPDGKPNPFYGKFPYISSEDNVIVSSGLQGFGIRIRCRRASETELVVRELYRRGILQNIYKSAMVFTNGNRLVVRGVYGVIEDWVEYRKSVLTKSFTKKLEGLAQEKANLGYFIRLISKKENTVEYLRQLSLVGKEGGSAYLKNLFPDIDAGSIEWISNRRASAFHKGDKYLARKEEVDSLVGTYEEALSDLNTYIYNDLGEVKKEFGKRYERITEITFKDYKFNKVEEKEVVDETECFYIFNTSEGTLTKSLSADEYLGYKQFKVISAKANSVLVGFDNQGNLLRIYGSDFKYSTINLASYVGVSTLDDSYKVLYLGVVTESPSYVRVLYRNGLMSTLDLSEFADRKQKKRFVKGGMPKDVVESFLGVYEESSISDLNSTYLLVREVVKVYSKAKGEYTSKVFVGVAKVSDFLVKSRKARIRAFGSSRKLNLQEFAFISEKELLEYENGGILVDHSTIGEGSEVPEVLPNGIFAPNLNSWLGRVKLVKDDIFGTNVVVSALPFKDNGTTVPSEVNVEEGEDVEGTEVEENLELGLSVEDEDIEAELSSSVVEEDDGLE